MPEQHQSSHLLAARQGEEGYEAATERSYLVRIDCVSHAVDIHLADAEIAVRNPLQRRDREVAASMAYESGK